MDRVVTALVWIGAIAGGLTALGVILATGLKIARVARRITHFADDWFGEAQRPGVPGRPGVMEQLQTLATHSERTDQRLDAIEHELKPNSGKSLRDAVNRVEEAVTTSERKSP